VFGWHFGQATNIQGKEFKSQKWWTIILKFSDIMWGILVACNVIGAAELLKLAGSFNFWSSLTRLKGCEYCKRLGWERSWNHDGMILFYEILLKNHLPLNPTWPPQSRFRQTPFGNPRPRPIQPGSWKWAQLHRGNLELLSLTISISETSCLWTLQPLAIPDAWKSQFCISVVHAEYERR
jgi:hypothetical protein